MDSDGKNGDAEYEGGLLSVRERAQMLGSEGDFELESHTESHRPFKYDDALKYRFPERKDYVTAHNYVPSHSGQFTKRKTNTDDLFRRKFQSSFAKESQSTPRDEIRQLSASKNKQWTRPPRAGVQPNDTQNSMTHDRTPYSSRFGKSGGTGPLSFENRSGNAVFEFDGDKTLASALRDGTQAMFSRKTGTNLEKGNRYGMDAVSQFNNLRNVHRSALAEETGDKIYFNMRPQVYDYTGNRYHPLTLQDEDAITSNERNSPFDYNMA